jgi:hypothetical protein
MKPPGCITPASQPPSHYPPPATSHRPPATAHQPPPATRAPRTAHRAPAGTTHQQAPPPTAIPAARGNSIAGTRPLMLNQSRRQQPATTACCPLARTNRSCWWAVRTTPERRSSCSLTRTCRAITMAE